MLCWLVLHISATLALSRSDQTVAVIHAEQALPQWPNTVSVGTKPAHAVGGDKARGSRMGRAVAAVRQRTLGSQPQLGDHVQALWTGYKSVLKPDQNLLDRSLLARLLLPWLLVTSWKLRWHLPLFTCCL